MANTKSRLRWTNSKKKNKVKCNVAKTEEAEVVLGTDGAHCDSGSGAEAYFGAGTKLTVLGEKST